MDRKVGKNFWSGQKGGMLAKLTDKQKKKNKQKGFKPLGNLTCLLLCGKYSC
jgi:hypothetical protein